jgi:hypothetical protein
VGPVATVNVSGNSFVALGQTVDTSATTVFGGGYTGISSINAADVVKVHGTQNSDGSIAATRVELVAASTVLPGYAVVGSVATLSTSSPATFTINGLSVTDTTSTILLPAGATLAAGDQVTVFAPVAAFASTSSVAPTVTASVVRVHPSLVGDTLIEGGRVRTVTDTNSAVSAFTMDGFTVDTTSSSLTIIDGGAAGTLADIVVGVRVVVEGTVSSSGTLVASKIWIATPQVLLAGPVYSLGTGNSATAGSFVLRHTPVNYNASTVFAPAADTWSNLAVGGFVVVTGTPGATGVTATTVTFTPIPCGVTPLSLDGDAPANWSAPSANSACVPVGSSSSSSGSSSGTTSSGTSSSSGSGSGTSVTYHYAGTASAVAASGSSGSFTLTAMDGTTITVDVSSTTTYAVPGQSISNLVDGSKLLVLGTLSGGIVDASLVVILQ